MIAEFHAGESHNEVLAKLIFIFLSVIVTIFMLNLMINLMGEFMAQVHEEEV